MIASAQYMSTQSFRRASARSRIYMMVRTSRVKDPLWAFDIGLGGLQVKSSVVVFPGTYLDLAFRLPGSKELHKVGAQVATLGDAPDDDVLQGRATTGGVALGLRFCKLTARVQMAIYRFLDKRRHLWTTEGDEPAQADIDKPFKGLLLDAYSALQAEELRELGFVCTPWPKMLNANTTVLGEPHDPSTLHDPRPARTMPHDPTPVVLQ